MMEIAQTEEKGYAIVEVGGEVDFTTSPEMRRVFQDVIDKGLNKILVDLEKVSFIDSSGIATLVEMLQRNKEQNGELHLVGVTDRIRGIFEIAKLDKLFSIIGSRQDVIGS